MNDREKIIKQLETDISRADRTGEMIVYVGRKTALGVIALLKEQEDDIRKLARHCYNVDVNALLGRKVIDDA